MPVSSTSFNRQNVWSTLALLLFANWRRTIEKPLIRFAKDFIRFFVPPESAALASGSSLELFPSQSFGPGRGFEEFGKASCMATLTKIHRKPCRAEGFSTVELVLVAGIILVLAGFAVPAVLNAYHAYQLSDVASQVAGVIKFTRYDAIHRNTRVPCIIAQTAATPPLTRIWSDSNGHSSMDPNEKQLALAGNVNLVDGGGVPGSGGLAALVGVQAFSPVPLSLASIGFDSRGALTTKGAYAVFVANLSSPDAGYRAIILLPSGSIQIWSSDAQGNWHFVN